MRYSKQRELVMQTVERLCDHPTAEEIYDKAAQECPNLSLGTVYRNLNSLVEAGRVPLLFSHTCTVTIRQTRSNISPVLQMKQTFFSRPRGQN